uniref:Sulfotransferase n=1 Tax=Rhizophora mucronata TaxID=61149 RepID=A0A2P2LLX3_RHIMU
MASPNGNEHDSASKRNEECREDIDGSSYNSLEEILSTLPRETGWTSEYIYRYQGLWINPNFVPGTLKAQQQFRARSTDIFLVTTPKSSTTWLKALIFSIVNRTRYDASSKHPLFTANPHDCFSRFGN